MAWEPRKHLPIVVGVGILIAAVGLVMPWWSLEGSSGGASGTIDIAPFSSDADGELAGDGAVVAVGVLDLVGLLAIAGGLALWLKERGGPADQLDRPAWLWLVGGGFLLVAALAAVVAWPPDNLGFWDSAGGPGGGVETGASLGWYLTLVAGAVASVSGLAWLSGGHGEDRPVPEPE